MLARVAEQIFWMSRYVERGLAVSRLLDVTLHLELDAGEDEHLDLWSPLLGPEAGHVLADSSVRANAAAASAAVRQYLALGPDNPNALVACVRNARLAARGVRESISSEMWEQLNTLYLSLAEPHPERPVEDDPSALYRSVRDCALAFQGLADSTLAHGEDWHFFCLGKYLERADAIARVLMLQAHLLSPSGNGSTRQDETVRWLAVLRSCGCAEAYARYYSLRVEPARVIEFLLFNPIFPQSIRFSLNAAWSALRAIAAGDEQISGNAAVRALGLLHASVDHAAVDEVLETGLSNFLSALQQRICEVADHVTRVYLRPELAFERPMPATRAAMLMATQQQQ
jgi:uncharacterized alpha-E superfamily protein